MTKRYGACVMAYIDVEFDDDGSDLDTQAVAAARKKVAHGVELGPGMFDVHSPGPTNIAED